MTATCDGQNQVWLNVGSCGVGSGELLGHVTALESLFLPIMQLTRACINFSITLKCSNMLIAAVAGILQVHLCPCADVDAFDLTASA